VTPEPSHGEDSVAALRELMDALPGDATRTVFTHASWAQRGTESYERLAFLGDSVLSLAVTSHIFPLLDRLGPGELTKIRAQTVSGRSCRVVAERLGVPERLVAAAPTSVAASVAGLLTAERVLASITEAVIGACYLEFGYERVAAAVVEAFREELAEALERPVDFKSALQERLARRGSLVRYVVVDELGPPHERTFTIVAMLGDQEIGRGVGRSKKDAEQAAARAALAATDAVGAGR
jgi:ribonuclease-3